MTHYFFVDGVVIVKVCFGVLPWLRPFRGGALRPGAWRRVAAVNGVTDPSRIRPGQTVYLPNVDELAEAGR